MFHVEHPRVVYRLRWICGWALEDTDTGCKVEGPPAGAVFIGPMGMVP